MTNVTPRGWIRSDMVGEDKLLLTYADGTVRFQHTCDRGKRGILTCAPRLQLGAGHTLTRDAMTDRATVAPSILCDDCGTHGFVTDGVWAGC